MVNKISDIKIGKEYHIFTVKNKELGRKCIVRAIINERKKFKSNKTEILVDILNRRRSSTHLFFCSEVGIGETKREAFGNYGRFKYEENPYFKSTYIR